MTITPQQAQEWLNNSRHQPVKPEKLARYVADIQEGNWRLGEEARPIIIKGGQIANGYHRLTAIVQANKEVEMKLKEE